MGAHQGAAEVPRSPGPSSARQPRSQMLLPGDLSTQGCAGWSPRWDVLSPSWHPPGVLHPPRGAGPGLVPLALEGQTQSMRPAQPCSPTCTPSPRPWARTARRGRGAGLLPFPGVPSLCNPPPRDPLFPILTLLLAHGHAPTPRFTQGPAEASKQRRMSSTGREWRRRRRGGRPCWAPAPEGRQVMGWEVQGPYEITAGRVAPGVLGDGDGSKSWWRGPAPWCCRTT